MNLNEKEELAKQKLCLPLDNLYTLDEVRARVEELHPVVGKFKVGKGSYTRFGPAAVKVVQDYGAEVFLDLKFKDIPNTVQDAADAATSLGVYMFNVHIDGGSAMLRAAVKGANEAAEKYNVQKPKVIGVTVLTSIDNNILKNELDYNPSGCVFDGVQDYVFRFARLAEESGLDGIVCSANDLGSLPLNIVKKDFLYVTPGIEGPGAAAGSDQKRVSTPGQAITNGSSLLVVGRAITGGKTPEERLERGYKILQDMALYL